MILILPDGKSLDRLEQKMTAEDFKSLMSETHESDDDVLVINECVNLTMPLIDSTYVNHHLDKSVLQVRALVYKIFNFSSSEVGFTSKSSPNFIVPKWTDLRFKL